MQPQPVRRRRRAAAGELRIREARPATGPSRRPISRRRRSRMSCSRRISRRRSARSPKCRTCFSTTARCASRPATRASSAGGDRAEIVARLSEAQYLSHLRKRVERLHPADVAYVLEALPREERLLVWDSVKAEADGAILLEVSEPVRDSLIESMTRAELVAAVKEPRRRRPRRPGRSPADRSGRRGAPAADAGGARAAARRDVLSGGFGRRAHGLRPGHRARGREAGGGAALPAPLRRAAAAHRPGLRRRSLRHAQGLAADRPAADQRAGRRGLRSHEARRAGVARARRRRRGGPGLRALRPGVGAGDRSARPPDRPADDRRGGRRHPRGGRSRRAAAGRPARGGGHVRVDLVFGAQPLAVAGAEPGHRLLRVAGDRPLRRHDRAGRGAGRADADRRRHRRQFRQPDDDAGDPLAGARAGEHAATSGA